MSETLTIEEFEQQLEGFSAAITYLALASELPPDGKWCIPETVEQRRDYRDRMVNAYAAQAARIAELEAMLSRIEWSAHDCDSCSVCYAPENNGHYDNCKLAALLPTEATDELETS